MKLNFYRTLAMFVVVTFAASCATTPFSSRHYHRDLVKVDPLAVNHKKSEESQQTVNHQETAEKVVVTETAQMEHAVAQPMTTGQPESLVQNETHTTLSKKVVADHADAAEETLVEETENNVVVFPEVKEKEIPVGNKDNTTSDDMFILALIFAILIPPVGVAIYEGITTRFWISLLLTLLFFLPGMIYSILVVVGAI